MCIDIDLYFETIDILNNYNIRPNIHRPNASGIQRTVVWGKKRPTVTRVGNPVLSQNFGLISSRFPTSDGLKSAGIREGNNNKKYETVYNQLKKLIREIAPDFQYTSITVNKNFKCNPHKDRANKSPSLIIGLGDYSGGELNIEGVKYDIKCRALIFNGSLLEHSTEPFTGTRYSIVYYSI